MFETYGPVIKTTDMGRTNYFTNDPVIAVIAMSESPFFSKYINENHPLHIVKNNAAGLFIGDTDTEEWRLAHKFMASAFSVKAVRHYTPSIQKTVESSYPVFDELDKRGEAWNVPTYMLKVVSTAIGKLVLNQEFSTFDDVDAPQPRIVTALEELLSMNRRVGARGQWYSHLPFGEPKRLKELNLEARKMVEEAVNTCNDLGVEDLPMAEAALKASSVVDYALRAADAQGNKCPREVVVRLMLIILTAGFFTTSTLLAWLVNGLVSYPGMQDRLLQELVDHGINGETQWTYDNTNDLPFLDKFLKETLRLHTPVNQPARTAMDDLILPGGYKIPSGATMIVVSDALLFFGILLLKNHKALHHIHNNADVWDNPHRFNPDRWDTEEVKNRHKAAFIPFAFGPRSCIGFNLALQEAKVIFPSLVYRYEFSRVGEDPVHYDVKEPLQVPGNLYVRAKRRTEWPAPAPKSA